VTKHSIANARINLSQLVREAEAGQVVELTRRGEKVAVLIGQKAFDRLTAPAKGFWEALTEFRQDEDLDALDLDPDEIFVGVRDQSPGRDPRL
jgi:prevent-host-death family protein